MHGLAFTTAPKYPFAPSCSCSSYSCSSYSSSPSPSLLPELRLPTRRLPSSRHMSCIKPSWTRSIAMGVCFIFIARGILPDKSIYVRCSIDCSTLSGQDPLSNDAAWVCIRLTAISAIPCPIQAEMILSYVELHFPEQSHDSLHSHWQPYRFRFPLRLHVFVSHTG